jgi:helix-turn-helix protein
MSVDRFVTLLYGIGEAASYLAIPPSTLTTWAYGYERRRAGASIVSAGPIVTAVRPERAGDPVMPFIGLAEAYALAAFRHAGVPMQRIRPARSRTHAAGSRCGADAGLGGSVRPA